MERDHVIDIAKGLGEILVCIGHSKFATYYEVKLIYQFHMPLFFILSGMMINIEKYSIFKFIKKKMETILFSYFTISFYSLFNSIVQNKKFNYKKYFFQTLKGKQEGKNYWFIHSLFVSQCLVFIILKIISYLSKNKIKRNLLVFLLVLYTNYYGYYYAKKKHLYYNLNLTLLIMSYIIAGFFIKSNRIFFNKFFFNIFFSPFYCYYYLKIVPKNSNVFFDKSQLGKPYYSSLLAYLGFFFILSLSNFIKSNYILEYIGKNSLYVFFIHIENKSYFDNFTIFCKNFIPEKTKILNRNLILLTINITLILIKTSIYTEIFKFYFPWFLNFSFFYKCKIKKISKNKNNKISN